MGGMRGRRERNEGENTSQAGRLLWEPINGRRWIAVRYLPGGLAPLAIRPRGAAMGTGGARSDGLCGRFRAVPGMDDVWRVGLGDGDLPDAQGCFVWPGCRCAGSTASVQPSFGSAPRPIATGIGRRRRPMPPSDAAHRDRDPLSTAARASADFSHSPATCLVGTLRRFHTLIRAMERSKLASARSS